VERALIVNETIHIFKRLSSLRRAHIHYNLNVSAAPLAKTIHRLYNTFFRRSFNHIKKRITHTFAKLFLPRIFVWQHDEDSAVYYLSVALTWRVCSWIRFIGYPVPRIDECIGLLQSAANKTTKRDSRSLKGVFAVWKLTSRRFERDTLGKWPWDPCELRLESRFSSKLLAVGRDPAISPSSSDPICARVSPGVGRNASTCITKFCIARSRGYHTFIGLQQHIARVVNERLKYAALHRLQI
jgi:hypothetical protein